MYEAKAYLTFLERCQHYKRHLGEGFDSFPKDLLVSSKACEFIKPMAKAALDYKEGDEFKEGNALKKLYDLYPEAWLPAKLHKYYTVSAEHNEDIKLINGYIDKIGHSKKVDLRFEFYSSNSTSISKELTPEIHKLYSFLKPEKSEDEVSNSPAYKEIRTYFQLKRDLDPLFSSCLKELYPDLKKHRWETVFIAKYEYCKIDKIKTPTLYKEKQAMFSKASRLSVAASIITFFASYFGFYLPKD